jgi:hypothetical protein
MKLEKPRRLNLVIKIKRASHKTCSYICMYINAVASSVTL